MTKCTEHSPWRHTASSRDRT